MIVNKIDKIVKSASKNIAGGHKFFDQIDHAMKQPENEDIVLALFQKIYDQYGVNYNMVISGGFGDLVMWLIEKQKIKCNGTILQLSGGLTSHFTDMDKIKKAKVAKIEKSIGDFEKKNFIFIDDSYYSGTTGVSINNFLNKVGSKIIKTYVIYDGNDKKSSDRISLYNYYDWNKGSNRTIDELMAELKKYDGIPTDVFHKKIIKGEITSIIQLRKEISQFKIQSGQKGIDVYTRVREGFNHLKTFDNFYKK